MADQGVHRASVEFFQNLTNSKKSFADDRVCVIGIIGKGSFGYKSKARHINSAIEKDLFKLGFAEKSNPLEGLFPSDIEVHHDVEQRIIYLHLVSLFDASRLALLCEQTLTDCSSSESHRYWKTQEYYHACSMLFLFSVCHIMVMIHPSSTFDLGYIRLFRTLATARHQLLNQISHCLGSIEGLPEIWRQTGRPCIPRLVCSFKQIVPFTALDPTVTTSMNKDTYASRAKVKTQANNSQGNLQNALQDQIYHIMRKARLLGSLSSSSLFTVSSGHAFVHVEPSSSSFDPINIMLNKLAMPAIRTQWAESSMLLKDKSVFKPFKPVSKDIFNENSSEDVVLFKDYLKLQIDNLMTGDAGRDGVAEGRRGTHVEVPSCRQWAQVCAVLYDFYMNTSSDTPSPFTTMASQLDLDMKFSEGRCRKVLPLASSAYLEGLPSHYTHSVHLNQLAQAQRVFALHARGPAYEHYAAQLQDECNKIWLNGRQLCEERSLTGSHCVYPYHKVPESIGEYLSEKSREDGTIPCKPHSSRITSLCACNCGRTQEHRDDPFDIRTANYDFFKVLEDKCCAYLIHLVLPCHPSFSFSKTPEISLKTSEAHEDEPVLEMAVENKSPPSIDEGSGEEQKQANQGSRDEPQPVTPHVSGIIPIPKSALMSRDSKEFTGSAQSGSHCQSSNSMFSLGGFHSMFDNMSHEGTSTEYKSVTSVGIGGETSTAGSQEVLSTAESQIHPNDVTAPNKETGIAKAFLQTMLSDQSPAGFLPRFPSWSICRLGNLSSYQPAKGLEQPGFFPGSNFLLAWDIPLLNSSYCDVTSQFDSLGKHQGSKTASTEAWPAPNELPVAGSTPSLPLHQALSYAQRQCTESKGNPHPLVVTAGLSKGSSSGGSMRSRGRNQRDTGPSTVRAYIGNEYECPRGHRFICSGPDKMVKATTSGHVKESAHKLVTMDMPLYFPCPCRSSKPLLAQLARIFVATPDSPVLISLNPRVQPASPPCPVFYPGPGAGISIPPASFCVLRFPYVYVGTEGPILPPGDSQPLLSCRLLKGTYSVTGRE